MKFLIPANGKTVSQGKKLISIPSGEFETDDKELQELLKKCKNVSEVKQGKQKQES